MSRRRIRRVLSHGLSYTPEYRAWQTARHRCASPKSPAWLRYGGRGITMAPEWLNDPAAFLAHVGPRPSTAHELDRLENNRGYVPGNVRWTTRPVNDRNRRSNRIIEHAGRAMPLVAWAAETGIPADSIAHRLRAGWPVDQALTKPVKARVSRRPCAGGCGAMVLGVRCQPCENRRRPRGADGRVIGNAVPGRTAKALVRALLEVL